MIIHSMKTPEKSLVLGISSNWCHHVIRTDLDCVLYALLYYSLKEDRIYEYEDAKCGEKTKTDHEVRPNATA